jgi:F-box domain
MKAAPLSAGLTISVTQKLRKYKKLFKPPREMALNGPSTKHEMDIDSMVSSPPLAAPASHTSIDMDITDPPANPHLCLTSSRTSLEMDAPHASSESGIYLPNLPHELLLLLFSHLDNLSLLSLRGTNTYFHSLISREAIISQLYADESPIKAPLNLSLRSKEQLACFQCYKLRSAIYDFDPQELDKKYTVNGSESGKRRCLICKLSFKSVWDKWDKKGSKTKKEREARISGICQEIRGKQ